MGDNFTIDEALPWGDMPNEALISKFEETDTGESEYLLDEYQRGTLADFRPDARTLEQDQVQRNTQSAGFLNHRYTGTRSGQEVHQPELFLGFHGEEDRDPRRTFDDPDFKELKKQHEARTKFVRWNSDADNSITGGGWREDQVQAAKQELIKSSKSRLKIFTTSKDGRREGMNRTWEHRSIAEKVDGGNYDMSDYVRDASIVPQRKTVILSNRELSNGKFYNMHQPDHEFEVARYGDNPRSGRLVGELGSKKNKDDGEAVGSESAQSRAYKTAGILMGKLVQQKSRVSHDGEYEESEQSRAYKSMAMSDDLGKLAYAMKNEAEFMQSDNSATRKSLTPGNQHASNKGVANHALPDHVYLNAELMYKSVQPGADTLKIKSRMVTTNTAHEIREKTTQARKAGILRSDTGKKKSRSWMEVDGESLNTVNYKTNLQHTKHSKKKNYNGESFGNVSAEGPTFKTPDEQYRITQKNDIEHDMRFLEYETKDRRVAPIGSKFTRDKTDVDGQMGDIAMLS